MTRAGTDAYRKSWAQAPDGFFEAEAAGLRWLAAARERGGVRVVEVLGTGAHHIDLERLRPGVPTRESAEDLGRALAATHGAGAPAFGAPPPGWTGDAWIGREPQTNNPSPSWGAFYAEQRVRPFVRIAVDRGNLTPAGARVVESVCDRVADGQFDDDSPPSRIHGDLWAGNVVFTPAGAVLIDPSAHGGHGLTDLAMLALFGLANLDVVFAAYTEAAGLDWGWRRLLSLHQMHPLATHVAAHGPAYGEQLVAAARSYT